MGCAMSPLQLPHLLEAIVWQLDEEGRRQFRALGTHADRGVTQSSGAILLGSAARRSANEAVRIVRVRCQRQEHDS